MIYDDVIYTVNHMAQRPGRSLGERNRPGSILEPELKKKLSHPQ